MSKQPTNTDLAVIFDELKNTYHELVSRGTANLGSAYMDGRLTAESVNHKGIRGMRFAPLLDIIETVETDFWGHFDNGLRYPTHEDFNRIKLGREYLVRLRQAAGNKGVRTANHPTALLKKAIEVYDRYLLGEEFLKHVGADHNSLTLRLLQTLATLDYPRYEKVFGSHDKIGGVVPLLMPYALAMHGKPNGYSEDVAALCRRYLEQVEVAAGEALQKIKTSETYNGLDPRVHHIHMTLSDRLLGTAAVLEYNPGEFIAANTNILQNVTSKYASRDEQEFDILIEFISSLASSSEGTSSELNFWSQPQITAMEIRSEEEDSKTYLQKSTLGLLPASFVDERIPFLENNYMIFSGSLEERLRSVYTFYKHNLSMLTKAVAYAYMAAAQPSGKLAMRYLGDPLEDLVAIGTALTMDSLDLMDDGGNLKSSVRILYELEFLHSLIENSKGASPPVRALLTAISRQYEKLVVYAVFKLVTELPRIAKRYSLGDLLLLVSNRQNQGR